MTPTNIIDSTIKLLELNDWNKKQYALDKDKNPVAFNNPKATSYCLQGALMRVCYLNREISNGNSTSNSFICS